jgi:nucleoid DNA-binding protein
LTSKKFARYPLLHNPYNTILASYDMASAITIYAWAAPGFFEGSPADHTWVTAYDNRVTAHADIEEVIAAGSSFWFCRGIFRPRGRTPTNRTGFLGARAANLALAQCLVEPNSESRASCGTIRVYGWHGVCHQIANQVLYATKIGNADALTVKAARWYGHLTFRYGTYGIPSAQEAFERKIESCGKRLARTQRGRAGGGTMRRLPDEFEIRARQVLGARDEKLLNELLAARSQAQQVRPTSSTSADELNAQNQKLFDYAANLLGPERFEAIFGSAPFQKVNLVDPRLLEENRERHSEKYPQVANVAGALATAPRPVITLKHLAASLADNHEMSKKQTEAVLEDLVGLVTKHLKKGNRIRIGGLGILQVRKRAARMGRNPATGEPLKIKAAKKVAFRAAKELKDAV